MSTEDTILHVIITGSRAAGISSFIAQKEENRPDHDEAGMGIDIQNAQVYFNGEERTVIFYEISGAFPLDSLRKILKKKRLGFAVVFDLSNPVSLELAEVLFSQISARLGKDLPGVKFLLGTHLDLEDNMDDESKARQSEAIEALLTIMGAGTHYAEFSTKTGENMRETMELIVKKVLEKK